MSVGSGWLDSTESSASGWTSSVTVVMAVPWLPARWCSADERDDESQVDIVRSVGTMLLSLSFKSCSAAV